MPASMINFSLANGNSQTQEYNRKVARRAQRVVGISKLPTSDLPPASAPAEADVAPFFALLSSWRPNLAWPRTAEMVIMQRRVRARRTFFFGDEIPPVYESFRPCFAPSRLDSASAHFC